MQNWWAGYLVIIADAAHKLAPEAGLAPALHGLTNRCATLTLLWNELLTVLAKDFFNLRNTRRHDAFLICPGIGDFLLQSLQTIA
jgi:hypothetical protein